MLYDVHAHILPYDPEGNFRDLARTAERYGVDRYYFSSLDGTDASDEASVDEGNRIAERYVKAHPDLLRGYVYVNPRNKNAMDVLKKGIEEQGLSGLKLLTATYCSDPLVYPLIEKMIEYGKPTLIHTFVKAVGQLPFESTSLHVAALAARYPEAKLIMAHLGGEPCHGIRPVAKYRNVWIDHSGTLVGSYDLRHTIDLVGVDRVLFGSDMPIAFASCYGQVLECRLTDEEREKIFWKNTAKLFGEKI